MIEHLRHQGFQVPASPEWDMSNPPASENSRDLGQGEQRNRHDSRQRGHYSERGDTGM